MAVAGSYPWELPPGTREERLVSEANGDDEKDAPNKQPTPEYVERDNFIIVEQVHRYLNSTHPEMPTIHHGQPPGVTPEAPQWQAYVCDILIEMAVQWMDVRWRTVEGYWARERRWPSPASSSREVRDTREYINSFIHGGNLRHDTVITSIGYATSRLNDHLTGGHYQDMQKRQFCQTYHIDLELARWLIQQPEPRDPDAVDAIDWPRVVNTIDRYITCHSEETQIKRGVIKYSGDRDPVNLPFGAHDYGRFTETVSQICAQGRAGESPVADEDLRKKLEDRAKDPIRTCLAWPSWAKFEGKPEWTVTQADRLRESLGAL
ncbi:hypothetical protein RB595_001412 [Gaeumannomyces hyphopodioides]